MGRLKTYDEGDVLDRAMEAFRHDGYAGLSVKGLEEATRVSAGSLYHAYGDKRGVFRAAFEHYNETVLRARIDRHAPSGSGIEGLRRLFVSLADEPGGGSFGCLITNSAVELGPDDDCPPLVDALSELRAALTDRLRESWAASDRVDTVELDAELLLALYQGTLVLIRAQQPLAALVAMVNHTFDELRKRYDH